MPRQRSPNRDKAFQLWQESGGSLENRRIAEILDIPEKTVSGWKCKDNWEQQLNGVLQSKKRSTPKEKGAQPGNRNAVGNGAPQRNKNAEKHGFFSKYLPEETVSIIQQIEQKSPLDIIWENIQIQYAAIVRAQQLMYVQNQEDKTVERIGQMNGENSYSEKWEVQQAWDKQASFLQAQSRAMTTLNGLIKQYDELLRSDLATEEQKARIAKLKAEVARQTGEGLETEDIADVEGDIYGS